MPRRDPGLFVIAMSAEVAGHLCIALQQHVKWGQTSGLALPAELAELEKALADRASRGQHGSPLSDLWQVRQTSTVPPQLVSYADAARILGVGQSTVKRLVRAGDLTAVHILGSARLQVAEIELYITRLTE